MSLELFREKKKKKSAMKNRQIDLMIADSSLTENESILQSKVKSIKKRKSSKVLANTDLVKKSSVKKKSSKVKKLTIRKQKKTHSRETRTKIKKNSHRVIDVSGTEF